MDSTFKHTQFYGSTDYSRHGTEIRRKGETGGPRNRQNLLYSNLRLVKSLLKSSDSFSPLQTEGKDLQELKKKKCKCSYPIRFCT